MSGVQAYFRLQRPDQGEDTGFAVDAGFSVPASGVTALFGPSGSGKTTLLRCLAGLEPAASGRLEVGGQLWLDSEQALNLPTHRRALGYVFQDARLFPHLNVSDNLAFGQRRADKSLSRVQARDAQSAVIELLGLAMLLGRYPAQLSGGEQQRVAIGRALLSQPRLLLLDEPLSALDTRRKRDILPYLDRVRRELAIPIIYVSHAIEEVSRLADHLVLIEAGRVMAQGPVNELLARLESPLSHDEEAGALITATVARHDDAYHLTELDFAGGTLSLNRLPQPPGSKVRVRVHARDVSLALERPAHSSILNILAARVVGISQEDRARITVSLVVGETALLARITRKSCEHLGLEPGKPVYAQVKSVALA